MTDRQALAKRLRELHERATPLPWQWIGDDTMISGDYSTGEQVFAFDLPGFIEQADAELIAELRNALPQILAALEGE